MRSDLKAMCTSLPTLKSQVPWCELPQFPKALRSRETYVGG